MAIEVVPHSAVFSPAVEAFNDRMRAGGSSWGFYPDPTPDWIPYQPDVTTWREYHLAVEDGEHVRGGYALKPQPWLVRGEEVTVADWQGPFTEAEVNPRFSPLMLRLSRAAEKQYSNLFSLGHSEKDAAVLMRLGWGIRHMPFCFHVLRPSTFFREAAYLRNTLMKRLACKMLAVSGAGYLALSALTKFIKLRHGRESVLASAHPVESFGDWADNLWHTNQHAYKCIAIRDKKTMNRLLPATGWPGGTRLRIASDGDKTIGWSVVLAKQMQNDPRYGNMKVGLIADVFANPEHSATVIAATKKHLDAEKVDMICCNLSHPAWIDGLRANGFVVLEDRRIFAFSRALQEVLDPIDELADGLHVTNLDGHGPHGFTFAD